MGTPIVESKPNKAHLFFLVFGFIFIDIILYNMIAETSKSPYPDLMEVILILVTFGFALGALAALWIYFPHLKIYTDRLDISYWGGIYQRTIRFSDISSIHTRHENNAWMGWSSDVWIIYTNDNKKYKIENYSINEDGSIDVCWIDAGHTEEEVDADIKAWLPKVKKGGIISGHDYLPNTWMGVVAAVDKTFGKPDGVEDWIWWVKVK